MSRAVAMRRAFAISLVSIAVFSGGHVSADRDDALGHASVQEVLLMVRGGVVYDVMVERVRRMQDVPALDAAATTVLMNKGVPDKVLLELISRRKIVTPCEIPERRVAVRQVLDSFSIRRVLRELDADVPTDAIVEQVAHLQDVPVLDARAITKLTSKGVPSRVLLELVRKQEVLTGCDPVRAELLAAMGEVNENVAGIGTGVPTVGSRTVTKPRKKGPTDDIFVELVPNQNRSDVGTADGYLPVAAETKEAKRDVSNSANPRENSKDKARSSNHRHDPPAAASTGMGRIRVVAKSSLRVTFLEVFLDGDSVTRQGHVRDGEAQPGWTLSEPLVLDVKRGAVVFESELPVGPHEVQAAFALSRVVATDWDPILKAHGQRYDTTKAGPTGLGDEVPVCEVREDSTCVVLARLVKRGDGYAVAYDSKMQ